MWDLTWGAESWGVADEYLGEGVENQGWLLGGNLGFLFDGWKVEELVLFE
jgi:hypothetical protein